MTTRPEFAHIYPAGEYTCAKCERPNDAGESYHLRLEHPYWCEHLCRDCNREFELMKYDKRRVAIRESEDKEPDDAQYTNEVVCPYCGYEIGDSWEYRKNEDETECPDCDHKFRYVRNIEVTYSTSRLEDDEDA